MRKNKTLILAVLTLSALIVQSGLMTTTEANPSVFINISTDRHVYGVNDVVKISGNVVVDGTPVNDALVALEVDLPYSTPCLLRTVQTGQAINADWQLNLTDLYTSDAKGNPVNNFTNGGTAYVTVKWQNYLDTTVYSVLALYMQFSTGASYLAYYPLGESPGPTSPLANETLMTSFPIPSGAPRGTTTVYASMYTSTPASGGYPMCPERNATFMIVTQYPEPPSVTQAPPNFTVGYWLNLATTGTYDVHAVTDYQRTRTSNLLFFSVQSNIGGNPDINGDGRVDMTDVMIVVTAFGSTPGKPRWNPSADLDGNGRIDMTDVMTVVASFGRHI